MQKYLVSIQVIRTYQITVNAKDPDEAKQAIYRLPIKEIERTGQLLGLEKDYAETIGQV